jgi:hypothetical protein
MSLTDPMRSSSHGAAQNLEVQPGNAKLLRQRLENPVLVVRRVHGDAVGIGKMKALGEGSLHSTFHCRSSSAKPAGRYAADWEIGAAHTFATFSTAQPNSAGYLCRIGGESVHRV